MLYENLRIAKSRTASLGFKRLEPLELSEAVERLERADPMMNRANPSVNSEPVLNLSKERSQVRAAHGDSSTGSELKAVEAACREASRTVEPLNPSTY